uniref:Uncharacterized protein n=1 Tax=Populus trichocarpa TaxID=3694 RepID=A0A2K1R8L0_POPTR
MSSPPFVLSCATLLSQYSTPVFLYRLLPKTSRTNGMPLTQLTTVFDSPINSSMGRSCLKAWKLKSRSASSSSKISTS